MKQLKVTLTKSPISSLQKHIDTVHALGLHKPNTFVIKQDCPEIRGMLNAVRHMVKVEEIDE